MTVPQRYLSNEMANVIHDNLKLLKNLGEKLMVSDKPSN